VQLKLSKGESCLKEDNLDGEIVETKLDKGPLGIWSRVMTC